MSGDIVFSEGLSDIALEHVIWVAAHECGHRILNHHRLLPAGIVALIDSFVLILIAAYAINPVLFWCIGLPVSGFALPIFAARIRGICEDQADAFAHQVSLTYSRRIATSLDFRAAAMTVPNETCLN